MNDQATLQLMRTLRLTGMADRFEALQTLPTHQQPSHDVLLPQLLESEDLYRNHRKTQTAIRNARFRYQASLSEIVCNTERNPLGLRLYRPWRKHHHHRCYRMW